MSEVRVPAFFVVGQPKSGTTALCEMLSEHPQIYMSPNKEPEYFSTDLRPRFPSKRINSPITSEQEYLSLFRDALPDQLPGEGSTGYLYSRDAAANIARMYPDARIIAILREPADFLRSWHLQLVQNHVETVKDLRSALALESQRRAGKGIPKSSHMPQKLMYSDQLRYVEHLERYDAMFPKAQIKVLLYDDFRADNRATLTDVLQFLEVEPRIELRASRANPTVYLKSKSLDGLLHSAAVGESRGATALRHVLHRTIGNTRTRSLAVRAQQALYGTPPPVDQLLMNEIRETYRPEVEKLAAYLDRDLVSLWLTDRS